eukprot:TRINITY_DN4731_c6_g1_i2.p1 TRINITY_DN4731_c6_g1~~TRINITY_DN4731_c6_g1_i2.p1  ORF type:complete len:344 (+),score=80.73 TRINITY_DN4731_c6_g1_i2:63-1034(+)
MKILTKEEYNTKIEEVRADLGTTMVAMYNSLVDGVVTDTSLMAVPVDDHLVCRGHGVFDTCTLKDGKLYRLEKHLERLLKSAGDARVGLPFEGGRNENLEKMKNVVIETATISKVKTGSVRYFMSVGPGNFGFTPEGCRPTFYVIVSNTDVVANGTPGHNEAVVTDVAPKDMPTIKSNNYMQNTLVAMSARDKGGKFGLQLAQDGVHISESCMLGVLVLSKDGRLLTPPLHTVLASLTVQKILSFESQLVQEWAITSASVEPIPLETCRKAKELILVGGDTHIFPITSLDGEPIGTGSPGTVYHHIVELIRKDFETGSETHNV